MGPLMAVGGVSLPAENVGTLERELTRICENNGFPSGQEFKWSPGRELWMRDNLIGPQRIAFFLEVLEVVCAARGSVTIIVEDTRWTATPDAPNSFVDLARLYIERVEWELREHHCTGIVIVDRPTGGRRDENRFLQEFQDTLVAGTEHICPEHIALNVLATQSVRVRLLQAADVITSCALAFVAGEPNHSPPVFAAILTMMRRASGRVGGVGLKIYPDNRYMNLYHWLLGDSLHVRGSGGVELPIQHRPYSGGPLAP